MTFLDHATIDAWSGDGGNGCISFRREKYIPFGGPDGGDGGRGGDIIAVCAPSRHSLADFRYRRHIRAKNGGNGTGKNRSGASGSDAELLLPPGTAVINAETGDPLADLIRPEGRIIILKGGSGGFGNVRYKSATDRAPRRANPGRPGQHARLLLQLKIIADAGLVGMPNAGKSTLLSMISAARPRIADWPFTTRHPIPGVVDLDGQQIVVADIPGLIRGASDGAGLGHRFLAHLERCGLLLHLVDATADDPVASWRAVRDELTAYGHDLADKPELVALSKCDAVAPDAVIRKTRDLHDACGACVSVSAHSGEGMPTLLAALATALAKSANADIVVDTPWKP